jgi:hypothetical protein
MEELIFNVNYGTIKLNTGIKLTLNKIGIEWSGKSIQESSEKKEEIELIEWKYISSKCNKFIYK